MQIFDHDDGAIDHGADGNGHAAQRHDVGVKPLPAHDQHGDEKPDRQADHRHQCGAQMEQEHQADDRHDRQLLQ